MDSILLTIKKLLGVSEEYTNFDIDIMVHINSALSILTQLGVGPENGFVITGAESLWSDFVSDTSKLEMIKTYIYLRVRLLFDPPTNSFVTTSIEKTISELEWRLQVAAEPQEGNKDE